ncbi:MAG: sarcosine oxidase subunit delta [Alphaproteobacteria bacterium]|nr:sarcosine oxidase subunit delta [Alphaproteobacteria bacterium]
MLLIDCPWCGPRDENEFQYGGEAHIARPKDPALLSDAQWADYLFMRGNPKGRHRERWMHRSGCRRWFNVERDTVSHAITAVYRMGEAPPATAKPAATGDATSAEPRSSGDPGQWPAGGAE